MVAVNMAAWPNKLLLLAQSWTARKEERRERERERERERVYV
jgi:hypothetical protein